jgi:hypothetical protein
VHGTWGRGFFPRRQSQKRRPFWFEDGSPFLARLSTELGDIPHKIMPLLWSGANSIFVRDETAHVVADHLSAEHAEHPQATQLVIAHSHGGNIALRALHHLRQRDASQLDGTDSTNPLVVTLATPFIEVHQADNLGWRKTGFIRIAPSMLVLSFGFFLWFLFFGWVISTLPSDGGPYGIDLVVMITVFGCLLLLAHLWLRWALWRTAGRASVRQKQLHALKNATQLGQLMSAQRLLVIRAIDDEASLILALGAILNYVTARSILFMFPLYLLGPTASLLLIGSPITPVMFGLLTAFVLGLYIIPFGLLMVVRTVRGRELAVSPMECQINTQSTPDAKGLSEIITLVRHTYVKSLRHGIYDHEDCAKTISDWVRSQLPPSSALPASQHVGPNAF